MAWMGAHEPTAGHGYDLSRRAPVAAGNAASHAGHAGGGARAGPRGFAALLPRDVGRGDLRRGDALPRRGSLGAARLSACCGAQHPVPDAGARRQCGRLHDLSRQCRAGVHPRGPSARYRHLPDLRLAELARADAVGDRRNARVRWNRRGRHLLYGRHPRPFPRTLCARLLCRSWRKRAGRTEAPTYSRSRTWLVSSSPTRRGAW